MAGLRVPADQRQITSSLPVHLADILTVSDGHQAFNDSSGIYHIVVLDFFFCCA